MIDGHIFGAQLNSLRRKHIATSLAHLKFTLFLSGYGNPPVRIRGKFFFWLLIQDRLSTRNLLKRKNMFLEDYSCVLYTTSLGEETNSHVFFDCPSVETCWNALHLLILNSEDPIASITHFRTQLHLPFAMEIIVTMSWAIWMARNDIIFRGIQPSLQHYKVIFKKELVQVILRAKASYEPPN